MGVGMIILLQMLVRTKKQIDEIRKEVLRYISYVTEEAEQDLKKENSEKMGREYEQNRLIQTVLGEYFP
jgi:hypothetical protein